MSGYEKPVDTGPGLRLHLNENTGGCSPAVREALARLTAEDVANYPDYAEVTADCAAYLGVHEDNLVLTNGLDEGILAVCVTFLRPAAGGRAETLVIDPTFEMYDICTGACGGQTVRVPLNSDLSFPTGAVLGAITDATRLICLANPNNPTGQLIPQDALETIIGAAPSHAVVFVDEAYFDFSGVTLLPRYLSRPGLVIGRTFAKAQGLAGLRVGALIAAADTLAPLRPTVPPYSVNAFAVTALRAALRDQDYVRRYIGETEKSKSLLYAMCEKLGLTFWPSQTNFVLIRIGKRAPEVVAALAAKGIFVRDRGHLHGCAGCIRVTAGVVAHTRACIDALEEVLCAAG